MNCHLSKLAGILFLAVSCGAAAQTYPVKPIRFIVPFAPGGSADILGRALSVKLPDFLGQPVVIDNRGGAGGSVGAEIAARAPADGYAVLFTTNGPVTVTPSLQVKPTYDPLKDFSPLTVVAELPNMLVAHPSVPVRTVKDVIALARAKPGQITYSSGGAGASNHLAAELFKYLAKVDLIHVPYKGGGPSVIAVVTGEVSFLFGTLPSVISHVQSGRMRAIAVTSDKRTPVMPAVPTIMESGVPGYQMTSWVGALVPAGTPAAVQTRLYQALIKAAQLPEVKERLAHEGYGLVLDTPEQMGRRLKTEMDNWSKVIKASGMTANN
jgi:tripartite-type tricarboxylate transporter receptor subunit TctC